jgi:LuxR family quorum sensing-dependent transcriptional regulator
VLVDETFELIEALSRLPDRPAILAGVAGAMSRFGLTAFILTALPNETKAFEASVLLNGWPQAWYDRYVEAGHYEYDPCGRYCRDTDEPFTWDEIPARYFDDPRAQTVVDEAATFGFHGGLCVPLHSVYGFRGLSMAGARIELPPGARRMAHVLGVYACTAADRTAARARVDTQGLSAREREVLRWTAVGKTAEEAAEILGLSPHTIVEHLKNIRRKLDVGNNVHAVVEAIRRGEISI